MAIVNSVPALFVAEDSPQFVLIRAMFALILIALIVYAIAMLKPFCRAIGRYVGKAFDLRKMIIAILGMIIATLMFHAGPVDAQNYPWCGQRGDGSTNCGYVSYEQCRAKSSWCDRNPMFQPQAEEPRSRRRPSGRHGKL